MNAAAGRSSESRHFDVVGQLDRQSFIFQPEPSLERHAVVSSNLLEWELSDEIKYCKERKQHRQQYRTPESFLNGFHTRHSLLRLQFYFAFVERVCLFDAGLE